MSGLYVHIPFCRSKCAYCDFYSLAARSLDATAYVDAVLTELAARRDAYSGRFATVYVGGGTPSVLPPGELGRLVSALASEARSDAEITVEVNPDDITPGVAATLRASGVNRVSMGVQSLVDAELTAISRRHDAMGAIAAIAMLREAGINNISCDLMYGLPGQSPESFALSIERLLHEAPDHISAYLLSYEPGTRLTRDLEAGRISQATDDEAENYYDMLCGTLREAGYEHYEISNFARPGRRSRHNSSYWNPAVAYLGLGPSAHSYDGRNRRRANVASVRRYLAAPAHASDPELCETLSPEQLFDERLMLGLRTADGLDTSTLDPRFAEPMMRRAKPWISSGALVLDGGVMTVSERSWLIADAILSDLFAD
ncbi:MAG: radical SAM family heme chaperone HemW [Paramuribaculum sp.]|nr:radical SAM family heme chaperone HemW [Paramuribaculum sp.]